MKLKTVITTREKDMYEGKLITKVEKPEFTKRTYKNDLVFVVICPGCGFKHIHKNKDVEEIFLGIQEVDDLCRQKQLQKYM